MARMTKCKCEWCKKPFEARTADVNRGWAKFCSKSCKAKKQEKRTGQNRAFIERRHESDHDEAMHSATAGWGEGGWQDHGESAGK